MISKNECIEFIVMLLIENRNHNDISGDFACFLKKRYNLDNFNGRYMKLLDKFMSEYALNKTEKSD